MPTLNDNFVQAMLALYILRSKADRRHQVLIRSGYENKEQHSLSDVQLRGRAGGRSGGRLQLACECDGMGALSGFCDSLVYRCIGHCHRPVGAS